MKVKLPYPDLGILMVCLAISQGLTSQSKMEWVLSQGGAQESDCLSLTDCSTGQYCYFLKYTPAYTGTLSSYTTAFFVDCPGTGNPVVYNQSCVMNDNSNSQNFCVVQNAVFANVSGNLGTIGVTKDIPVILHQLCLDLTPGGFVNILPDPVTSLSASIDTIDGTQALTDFPAYINSSIPSCNTVMTQTSAGPYSLVDAINCSSPGDTVLFSPCVYGATLQGPFTIDKDLVLKAYQQDSILFFSTGSVMSFLIENNTTVTLDGFHIMYHEGTSSTFDNNGTLTLKNTRLYQNANSVSGILFVNQPGGTIVLSHNVDILSIDD